MSGAVLSLLGSVNPIFGPLTVNVSPNALSGFSYGYSTPITSAPAILHIVGGVPPYTITWEYVSGGVDIVPTSPNGLTTYFSRTTGVGTIDSVWRAEVEDAAATTVYSPNVAISLTAYEYPSIGIVL